jgi:hypothetical protein
VGFGWTVIVHMGCDIDRLTILDRPFAAWADQCDLFKGLLQCVYYLFFVVVVVVVVDDVVVDVVVVGVCHDSIPASSIRRIR